MRRRGFTLIELLAVIVILAVIALIATPLIMGTITKAKKNAFIDTANGIIKAGENYQAEQVMSTVGDVQDLEIDDLTTDTKLQYKGDKPKSGSLKITSEGKTAIAIWSGQFCAVKGLDDKQVIVDDNIKTKENCIIPIKTTDESCFETETIKTLQGYQLNESQCVSYFTSIGDEDIVKLCQGESVYGITFDNWLNELSTDLLQILIDNNIISNLTYQQQTSIKRYKFENSNCPNDVVVPGEMDGKKIVGISSNAFTSCDKTRGTSCPSPVTSLVLPDTIVEIGSSAFYRNKIFPEIDLSNLKHITMLENNSLYYDYDSPNLKSVYLPNQYMTYMQGDLGETFGVNYWYTTLKLKKGSINTDDIVNQYNSRYSSQKSQTRTCRANILIAEKIRETDEYVEYKLALGHC